MNNLQLRLELQVSLQRWIDNTMSNYNISAAEMEDALSRILIKIKDKVYEDYLNEQQRAYQEMINASSNQENGEIEDV